VTRGVARLACIALVPLLVATLYLTYSRGGWLALALGLVGAAGFALRRLDRRVAAVVATGAIAAAVVAGVAVARSFDKATATPVSGAGRLTTLSGSSRTDYWRVAARDVADHPVLGSGAASYGRYWARERPVPQPARDAHSLPLETLAELGPLGLALLVVAFGAPILAGIRTRDDPLTPPAFSALVAFVAHAAQDWDWELPAVTVPAIACAVVLLLGARAREAPLAPMARRAGAGAAAVLAILAVAAYAGNRELALAEEGSESAARRASRLQPWSAAPLRALGEAQLSRGEVEQARETFLDALERDDGDWELWLDLALASEGAERDTALARAAELNPLAPEIDELRAEG
jgi:hypothetical protein